MAAFTLIVNGKQRAVEASPDTPLLWILRDTLSLTGAKYGCGVGVYGACTIHQGNRAVRACQIDRGRLRRVLEVARQKSAWSKPLAPSVGRRVGRGVACNVYDGESYLAEVAEVSVGREGDVRVHRIVCVIDCGQVINPLGLEGQAESGILWGLSAALRGQITFRNGGALESSYRDYPVIRMNDAPAIETHIVPGPAQPGGFGEHPVPLVAPAVANAVFAATGRRIRRLPIALNS